MSFMSFEVHRFVGNKAKGQISKRVLQENKALQIFRKTNISYPVSGGKKCSFLGKFGAFCFLITIRRFRPFALLPTNLSFMGPFTN